MILVAVSIEDDQKRVETRLKIHFHALNYGASSEKKLRFERASYMSEVCVLFHWWTRKDISTVLLCVCCVVINHMLHAETNIVHDND